MSGARSGLASYFGRLDRGVVGWLLVSFPVTAMTCVAIRYLLWSDALRMLVLIVGLFVDGVVADLVMAHCRGGP